LPERNQVEKEAQEESMRVVNLIKAQQECTKTKPSSSSCNAICERMRKTIIIMQYARTM
jgi:hypothetical protein